MICIHTDRTVTSKIASAPTFIKPGQSWGPKMNAGFSGLQGPFFTNRHLSEELSMVVKRLTGLQCLIRLKKYGNQLDKWTITNKFRVLRILPCTLLICPVSMTSKLRLGRSIKPTAWKYEPVFGLRTEQKGSLNKRNCCRRLPWI
jgi:hypothetical protein